MVIRREQYQSLNDTRFVPWMMAELRTRYTERLQHVSDLQLKKLVEHGLGRARRYGLQEDQVLATFISTMFRTAPAFDEHPKARDILANAQIPERRKFFEIHEQLTAADWRAITDRYDASDWGLVPRAAAAI